MPKAARILHEKIRTATGIVIELSVWQVTRSAQYPEGFKYAFFAVREGVVLVGYDNHPPKAITDTSTEDKKRISLRG